MCRETSDGLSNIGDITRVGWDVMFVAKKTRNNEVPDRKGDAGVEHIEPWAAPSPEGTISAEVSLPGSKSLMNRELLLHALADGPALLHAPLASRDSTLMIEGLKALGARFEEVETGNPAGPSLKVYPAEEVRGSTSVACGLAGTVMRFLPPVAALALGPVAFDGDPYARKRPMRELLQALKALGADIADEGRGALPFTVHGTGSLKGGRVEIDASLSSQFVSGLLLSAPLFDEGVHVVHTGERLPSVPHIEMTLACLEARGVKVDRPAEGQWRVYPGKIAARDITIEPDLSNAAPFVAAAIATGGSVSIPNWPDSTTQVGDQLRALAPAFGATVEKVGDVVTFTGPESFDGVNLDLSEAGELSPTMVGLAALANTPSTIIGIGHTRHHETNRIAALVENINVLGGNARELEDGVAVEPAPLSGGGWKAHADHRMATTGAVVGLGVSGVVVDDIECTSKTMPKFKSMWTTMLGISEDVNDDLGAETPGEADAPEVSRAETPDDLGSGKWVFDPSTGKFS